MIILLTPIEAPIIWINNPYQDHIISSSLRKLKLQNSDMDCWSILSDCLFYSISSLPQDMVMIITAPEYKFDCTIYRTVAATQPCHIFQFVTNSKLTEQDFLDKYEECLWAKKLSEL